MRLALVLPSVNTVVEPWLPRALPATASLHIARMLLPDALTSDNIVEMDRIDGQRAVKQLKSCRPDALLYGCVASSVLQGLRYDRALLREMAALSGVPCETAAGASISALQALGAVRILIVSPYDEKVDAFEHRFFEDAGFEIVDSASFGISNSFELAAVSEQSLIDRVGHMPQADAIFLSCMNMRSHAVVDTIEAVTGMPVVTATTASAWALLRLAGDEKDPGFIGRLGGLGMPASAASLLRR
ncbi:maleate cis-trans isomerase family protein [Sphingomonas abietis]|uniref:Asp/Glu racemase n=1 Tax=Sphingomonas abietis TaxID=3012344 RepID=A0ABY7NKE2_9SPHN|nr:hypothetical protein [Sphingomonas abietis]WBO21968.1 hypothetical protein PBT88_17665 [Sphingomonas abietis]